MRFRKEKEKTYSQANIDHLRSQLTAAQAENERLRLAMKDQYQKMQERIKELEGVISPEGYTVADELVYYKELCKAMGDEITRLREGLERIASWEPVWTDTREMRDIARQTLEGKDA